MRRLGRLARGEQAPGPPPPAVANEALPQVRPASPAADAARRPAGEADPVLVSERERLTEHFTMMQAELGGLFYEMAIRDHVRMEILMGKAAALQRIDSELAQVEHLLTRADAPIGGHCPSCGAVYARGAAFCSRCAEALTA